MRLLESVHTPLSFQICKQTTDDVVNGALSTCMFYVHWEAVINVCWFKLYFKETTSDL